MLINATSAGFGRLEFRSCASFFSFGRPLLHVDMLRVKGAASWVGGQRSASDRCVDRALASFTRPQNRSFFGFRAEV